MLFLTRHLPIPADGLPILGTLAGSGSDQHLPAYEGKEGEKMSTGHDTIFPNIELAIDVGCHLDLWA